MGVLPDSTPDQYPIRCRPASLIIDIGIRDVFATTVLATACWIWLSSWGPVLCKGHRRVAITGHLYGMNGALGACQAVLLSVSWGLRGVERTGWEAPSSVLVHGRALQLAGVGRKLTCTEV